MKSPLGYQCTEFDCVPTTIINGIKCLLPRESISPEAIKLIYLYSLDKKDKNGKIGGRGTSKCAIELICNSLNQITSLDVQFDLLKEKEVSEENINN